MPEGKPVWDGFAFPALGQRASPRRAKCTAEGSFEYRNLVKETKIWNCGAARTLLGIFEWIRGLMSKILGLGGKVEVFLGEAAGVVGDEGEADAVVADVYVGVVAGFFGEFADLIDEAK